MPFLLAATLFLAACSGEPGNGGSDANAPAADHPPKQQCVLTIEGMTCENCVNTITRVLSRCPGVATATVDLEGGTGTVKGDGLLAADLKAAVEEAGYKVTKLDGPADLDAPEKE
jgi:copper chaperone CopZ